ncbi:LysR family transcriptional regulator [Microvirga aerophila]|uniref:LysR family transcriptional regulator n=1 Tax=Microvirga aerophila TaxID=670291 RepID=A0A512BW04_9HYPH|nr:LysR family transcriptional regulator [Microvirga aerophila]GEO16120.1 LysR family transcriptional regulator [Microvirga aerophila]
MQKFDESITSLNRSVELSWLQDFCVLTETRNFSRSAEQRNMTQPAFSRRIRSLEEWLGVDLFDRSAQPISLTPAGRVFLPIAEETLRHLAAGRAAARAAKNAEAATLSFATTQVLSLTFFPDWLRRVEARVELGPIQQSINTRLACEEMIQQGQVQILVCHANPGVITRLSSTNFEELVIGRDRLIPVSSQGPDKEARYSLFDRSAKELPFLTYSAASGFGRMIRARLEELAPPVPMRVVFTSQAVVLKRLVLEGRGIAWLPEIIIRPELAAGALVHAGPPEAQIPVDIVAIRRIGPDTAASEAFWDEIRAMAKEKYT